MFVLLQNISKKLVFFVFKKIQDNSLASPVIGITTQDEKLKTEGKENAAMVMEKKFDAEVKAATTIIVVDKKTFPPIIENYKMHNSKEVK